ncbi:MAG: FAD-binding oxidoreductase [Archaeoglobaceae archaeon]|nr:FAD-binding oxidoreductase [Archaeoglobaceae archaeon]MDW8127788.1 FAD-binding oxidoreductase [Archaeoglobaceae archaeon]
MFEGLEEICKVYRVDSYAFDETPKAVAPKAEEFVVVKPENALEVSKILKFANERRIPVFIRGGGTGLSGGAVPTRKGILISTEKMRGIEIDVENKVAICQCGVTLEELSKTAEKHGLSFPPRPGAENATVGGMIATNAGGVRALKFGVMRNYVLGIEAVLPNGEIIKLGGKTLKNSSGYSLLHLIIGSEGTLAVITKAIIRLLPPIKDISMLAIPFITTEDALNFAIEASLHTVPMALEFMDKRAVEIGEKVSGKKWVSKEGEAHIMAIFERKDEAEEVAEIALKFNPIDVFILSPKEQRDLLEFRGKLYLGLKDKVIEILDVCIPPGEIAEYLQKSEELAKNYGIELITYGHLGDGNLHQHPLLYEDWEKSYKKFRKELLKLAIELGGVISGEHGIGVLKREELRESYPEQFRLMQEIKKIFDPNGILNPDRIF